MKIAKRVLSLALTAGIAVSSFGGLVLADETTDTSATEPETTTASSADALIETSPSTTESQIDLSGYTFENIYGSQLHQYLDHQYKFEGKEIPLAESNFYFINAFVEMTQYYGMYYGTSEGFLDLSAAYFEPDKYATFGDFLVAYAERTLESSYIICSMAQADNLALSDETVDSVNGMINSITESAKNANLSVEDYLKLYYGESCTVEAFKEVLKNYYLSDLYTSKYCETHITDDMKKVPNIRYALFEAPESDTEADAKKTAETLANELLNSAAGDVDKMKSLADQSYADGYCRESNEFGVIRGTVVQPFEDWSYDPNRKIGDMDVIYAPEFGYFVVAYLGLTDADQESLEDMVVGMLSDEITKAISEGKYSFGTEQEYLPAPTVAPDSTATVTPAPGGNGNGEGEKSSVATVLIIIFAIIGGVAVIAIIVILTAYALKRIKKNGSDDLDESVKPLSRSNDDIEDEMKALDDAESDIETEPDDVIDEDEDIIDDEEEEDKKDEE